jgi:uncharacterized protein YndB with AHSA1/START domain
VCMDVQTPQGPMQMWFTGEFLEVIDHERLVYTESMADSDGSLLTPADMGMPEDHPVTTQIHVEFEKDEGRTKMVMTHAGIPKDSPGAAGWTMAFDKLEAQISTYNKN